MNANSRFGTLYIAEKPSLARAVADVLPKPHKKGDGFIQVGNGDIVSWCIGHLLEQAAPEFYDERYKKWQISDLPIIPHKWLLMPKKSTEKQLTILKKLIHQSEQLVHVGDPDREGQLLIDEVINYCQINESKLRQVKRCLISDLNSNAVKKSLKNIRENREFIPLSISALARARADWLYGINMSRLCTIKGQNGGYKGVLSIGRVQTPVLGLVVKRDLEIENFLPKPFYEVYVDIKTEENQIYTAKWKPSAACESYQDEDGRIILKKLAETVLKKVIGKAGTILNVTENLKKQAPPLPYNLSALQIDVSKRFNLNAKKTMEICQQLYEKYKLITYPRSDCRYLPNGHYQERNNVTKAIIGNLPILNSAVNNADLSIKSKAWDDKKVTAHHAIIPTSRTIDNLHLSNDEKNVYELISIQYLMQFYPFFEYQEKQIDTEIGGGLFISRQKEIVNKGWKIILQQKRSAAVEEDFSEVRLPNVKKGEVVHCVDGRLNEKETSPPKYFTDATLLSAMTGISRYVTDPEIKKILKSTDGLGTEATRAGIIDLLFKREFLIKKGKEIRATKIGIKLITSLPNMVSLPDMTAHWESQLTAISEQNLKYNEFMLPMLTKLNDLIHEINKIQFNSSFKKNTK